VAVSLKRRGSDLASGVSQLRILNNSGLEHLPKFQERLQACGLYPLLPTKLRILQVNVGKMCNQVCKHCHVDAGPDRKEIMTAETMGHCLAAVERHEIETVDITGGAPEMNSEFRWFVERLAALGCRIMVRSNLTIILAHQQYHDLPDFFAKHRVIVVSSLPYYQKSFTDRQRGDGVFEKSISALKMLNGVGYGTPDTGLELNLVYNPAGAFLPGDQASLEQDFKRELFDHFEIRFNRLYTITNLPISRFLDFLIESGNLEEYMERLVASFNPAAAVGVMCRDTISVGWDGLLYDCDFNQMLEIPIRTARSRHVSEFDLAELGGRRIAINQHCFGCTAGAGSSCGGAVV
jgi:radical SAM/Cys-rich protein